MRRNLKRLVLGAVVAAGLVVDVPQADAFWGHSSGGSSGGSWGGSSGGSSGGYGGSSDGYYGSSGGSSGGYGSHGGWHARRAYRRSMRAYYHSSGGSYGSWGSSGGYYAGYYGGYASGGGWSGSSGGSSGGWSGSHGSAGGTVIQSDMPVQDGPVTPGSDAPATNDAPPTDTPANGDTTGLDRGFRTATLNVSVPSDAKVFVNGHETTSTGNQRRFVSKGLKAGYTYTYELKAEVVREGETVTETKVIKMRAGQVESLAFAFPGGANQERIAVRTSVKLRVPADAKVFLAGNLTRSHGEVREFSTTKLAAGQQWDNYVVKVELDRDGETLTQEKTLTLVGGEERDVNIEFDAPKLAQAGGESLDY